MRSAQNRVLNAEPLTQSPQHGVLNREPSSPEITLSSVGSKEYIQIEVFNSLRASPGSRRSDRDCTVYNHLLHIQMNPLQDAGRETHTLSRRDALAKLAMGSVALSALTALLVFLRVPIPSNLRERSLIRLGNPDRFPFNTFTFVPEKNIFIYRTREGFRALSALCPHLGCVITSTGRGFRCPCHGSTFDAQGTVLGGPAPKPLSWVKVGLAPDGQITVDTSERVSGEQFFRV